MDLRIDALAALLPVCEKCGEKMVVKNSRRGPFIACPGFPKCRNAKPLPDELRENVALLDEASLFLVPIESGKGASQVLRPLLSRVLP